MKKLNQSGSHLVALLLAVLVIGVIGFAGYTVWQRNDNDTTTTTASTAAKATAPDSINNSAELNQANAALDASSSQVDSSLNDNGLNSDLNDLL